MKVQHLSLALKSTTHETKSNKNLPRTVDDAVLELQQAICQTDSLAYLIKLAAHSDLNQSNNVFSGHIENVAELLGQLQGCALESLGELQGKIKGRL